MIQSFIYSIEGRVKALPFFLHFWFAKFIPIFNLICVSLKSDGSFCKSIDVIFCLYLNSVLLLMQKSSILQNIWIRYMW